ncbi:hypothetical protein FRC02_001197 [Tulasnella sp. 418]|nr:hypothetical protein FRC02_001197 [Tulasnella sp. 418]
MVQSSIQSASQVQTGHTAMLQDYYGTSITPSHDTMGRLLSILPQDPEIVSTISSWDMSGKVSCLAKVAGGGFSDVWKGTMSCDGQEIQMVAIKQLRIAALGELKSQERVVKRPFREVNTWRQLIHPNVVPLLGFSLVSDELPSLISP